MKIWRNKEQQIAAFFDQETSLTGELQFSGVVRIDGSFHGSINGGETLIVGSNAVIHADIRVREIEIHGQVFGNIEATGRAEIHSSGSFRGDIHTGLLVIHSGGVFDGHSHMNPDSQNSADEFSESTQIVEEESNKRPHDNRTGSQ
jgi:cytoskeletal protein CcmA (bactofilin family)